MQIDLSTLCIIAFILIVVFFVLPRLMGGSSPYSRRGPLDPEYDDPDIGSSGGFGGSGGSSRGNERPSFDDPNVGSRGSFGRGRSIFPGRSSGSSSGGSSLGGRSSSGRTNSPNVGSRGGFGRSKK